MFQVKKKKKPHITNPVWYVSFQNFYAYMNMLKLIFKTLIICTQFCKFAFIFTWQCTAYIYVY